MATFVASGAGTTEWNGTYTESGTYNGAPEYLLDSEHRLYWSLSGQWTFGDSSHPTGSGSAYNDETGGSMGGGPGGLTYSQTSHSDFPAPSVAPGAPAPDAPGVPTFSSVTSTTATVTYPTLPANAATMALQRSAHSADSWSTIDSGRTGGYAYSETGRTPGVIYDYRIVATGDGGSTNGTPASMQMLPAAPGVPTFSSIAQTTATITLPSLPTGAVSLTLQRSAHGADSWTSLDSLLSGGATYSETGRTAGTQYDYRAVAVNTAGSTVGSTAVMTMLPNAPSAPGLVTFNTITSTSFNAVLPSMPAGGVTLNLQSSADGSTGWTNVSTGLSAGAVVAQSGKTLNTSYFYRAVAVSTGGSTNGSTSEVSTVMPTPGNADFKIHFPASVSNPAQVAGTGTGYAVTVLHQGSATADTVAPGVTTYGSDGTNIPPKVPMLVQQGSHYRAANFTALDAVTRQSAPNVLEGAMDKAKQFSWNMSALVDGTWFADQNELGYVSHVDGERRTEIMLKLGADSTHTAPLKAGAEQQPAAEQAFAHRLVHADGEHTFEFQHYSSVRAAIPQSAAGNIKAYDFPLGPVLPPSGNAVKLILTRPVS